MAAHAIKHAVDKSGVDPADVEDVYLGNGAHGSANLARLAGLLAGLPVTTGGSTVQRHCSSGLNALALAANYIKQDGADVVVAGGVEAISQPGGGIGGVDPKLVEDYPAIFMAMIDTADIVAERYGVTRESQDEYALQSQQRTAAAQAAGLFDDEIVPMKTTQKLVDKETKEESFVDYARGPRRVQPPRDHPREPRQAAAGQGRGQLHHRGQRQPAFRRRRGGRDDGGRRKLERRNLEPLGAFKGWAIAGCEPDEMGIGPVFAVPRLLERHGLKVDDIDLWELNEAFAVQCLYSRDTLGIDPEKYNVNGGSISIGHPFGMTGARCAGHILQEGKRRGAKWGVVTMCIGGGQGAAGLLEIF